MAIFSFLGFTILVAAIAYWSTRGTDEQSSDGYFLGGRSLTAGVIAGSLLLTNLSTEQIVGLNGSAYQSGLSVMAWETLAAMAMVVTALFLLPRYLKGGLTTVPQFLADRFDVTTKTLTSGLFLTGYVVVLLPVILYSGSIALSGMFKIPELLHVSDTEALWICVWGIGITGSIYAVFGGLKAVAVSDSINAIGLLIGGILIPFFGLMAIGEGSVIDGVNTMMAANPDKFRSMGTKNDPVPFHTIFTGMMLVQLFYWGTNQQIIQRALAAKNLAEGQKGLLLGAFIKILGPLIVVLPGLIAYHIFGDGLASVDDAYPKLVNKVLPASLLGFFAAVLFGAILSSFNSVLNSSVTLFGIDIYKQHFNPDADDKTVVKYGKMFGIVLAFAAMLIAPLIANAGSLFTYLQEINGIYSIPILTIIFVGYFTKSVPAIAAKIGLVSGSLLYIISQFVMKPMFMADAKAPLIASLKSGFLSKLDQSKILVNTTEEQATVLKKSIDFDNLSNDQIHNLGSILDVDTSRLDLLVSGAYPHFLDVMAILFVLNVIIMLLIGKLNPRAAPYKLTYTKQVDITPFKYIKEFGIAICVIVIGIYWYFA